MIRALTLASLVLLGACGTFLESTEGQPLPPRTDDGGSEASDAAAADAPTIDGGGPSNACATPMGACGGTAILVTSFDEGDAGGLALEGDDVSFDVADGMLSARDGRAYATFDVPASSRFCIEMCVRVAYDPDGFGKTESDFVKLFDVTLHGEAGRAGGFNLGLADLPYVFVDNDGAFAVMQLQKNAIPRDQLIHLRLDVDYGATKKTELFIDGVIVAAPTAIPPLSASPVQMVASVGAMRSGQSPAVDARFADLRITHY